MTTVRDQVLEFHERFEAPIGKAPTVLSAGRINLRLALIAEEFLELCEALEDGSGTYLHLQAEVQGFIHRRQTMRSQAWQEEHLRKNMADVVDALADLDYVVEGMRIEMGVDGRPIAEEVHAANMAKLDPETKRPLRNSMGKVIKPEGWKPPDIEKRLMDQGWKV